MQPHLAGEPIAQTAADTAQYSQFESDSERKQLITHQCAGRLGDPIPARAPTRTDRRIALLS